MNFAPKLIMLPAFRGLLCWLTFSAVSSVQADGGAIIARQKFDGLNVTVFASPVPLRAGPVDVSVLVQDAQSKAILDATVELAWTALTPAATDWLPPCCSMNTARGATPALRSHSQNKLLYGAILPIRSTGPSEISIRVKTPLSEVNFSVPIEAAPPRPPLLAYWPLLAFPPVAVGMFALHQRLARRRR